MIRTYVLFFIVVHLCCSFGVVLSRTLRRWVTITYVRLFFIQSLINYVRHDTVAYECTHTYGCLIFVSSFVLLICSFNYILILRMGLTIRLGHINGWDDNSRTSKSLRPDQVQRKNIRLFHLTNMFGPSRGWSLYLTINSCSASHAQVLSFLILQRKYLCSPFIRGPTFAKRPLFLVK